MTDLPQDWPLKPENKVDYSIGVLDIYLSEQELYLQMTPKDDYVSRAVLVQRIADLKLAIHILKTSERIKL